MSRCYYSHKSNRGNEIWGKWVCVGSPERAIVSFCRTAFGPRFRKMWIEPIWFDDTYYRYTDDFFKEVGVALYPKLSCVLSRKQVGQDVSYEDYIWSLAQNDIERNKHKRVKPVYVSVTGSRRPAGDERIISVKVVDKSYMYSSEDR